MTKHVRIALTMWCAILGSCNQAPTEKRGPQPGRFVVAYSRILARDTFLVDTATGETWQLVEDKNKHELWQKMDWHDPAEPSRQTSFEGNAGEE